MPSKQGSEEELLLKSLKVRWNLLLRTARTDLELLSAADLDRDEEVESGQKENDPSCILAGLADMVADLQDILTKRKAMKKRAMPVPDGTNIRTPPINAVWSPLDIPLPSLKLRLETAERALNKIDSEMAGLNKKTPAKTHRSLLEAKEIHSASASSLKSHILQIEARNHDPSTIAETEELFTVLAQMLTVYKTEKVDLVHYLKNTLAHAILLALFSTTGLGCEGAEHSVSRIVTRFLDLMDLSVSHGTDSAKTEEREIGLLMVEVLRSGAIERLRDRICKLLDKQTKARLVDVYDGRNDADTTTLTIPPGKRKGQSGNKAKKATIERRYNEIEYFLLTRTPVSDRELLTDSFAISPATRAEREKYLDDLDHPATPPTNDLQDDTSDDVEFSPEDSSSNGEQSRNTNHAQLSSIEITTSTDGPVFETADEDALALPDAPSNALHKSDGQNDDDDDDDDEPGEVDEAEVERLVTLFASSPRSSDDDDDARDSADEMAELQNMTPAEQEAVFKALAAARENYLWSSSATDRAREAWDGDLTVDELLRNAKAELKKFGEQARQEVNDDDDDDKDAKDADK